MGNLISGERARRRTTVQDERRMAHRRSVGRLLCASLRLRSSAPSFFLGSARLLSSSSNTPSDEVDFLSRKRKQTEEKLEDLTEEGWEKKTPQQVTGNVPDGAAIFEARGEASKL